MFTLLQRGFNNPPPARNPPDAEGLFLILFCFGMLFVVFMIALLFLRSLSNCLKEVAPRNRQMWPGEVWYCLLPFIGIVWLIITVLRIADSLDNEYEDRRWKGDRDFGKAMGLAFAISVLVIGPPGGIFGLIYWIKISGYTRSLRNSPRRRSVSFDDDPTTYQRQSGNTVDENPWFQNIENEQDRERHRHEG
ncbi:hypothetical protein [Fimbriiglobus ruber]|uniref:hypothetical protein n=1 Tax=Fimbriiglobus ruber TaxID=1908690 RepID=UPI001179E488|nr:hypothetical protein [Fimbriiglobus ruber]